MNGNVYLLSVGSDPLSPDIIYSRDSELKLSVYRVEDIHFVADESEIQLYGYLNNHLLAFETIDVEPEDALEVITAIRWYSGYMGSPKMEILPDDPRVLVEIAVAL